MVAAAAGFDWLFIDMEHGAMGVEEASAIAIAALSQGVTPVVRVCKDALHEGTRCLDNGAMGVVVPHVDTAEEAEGAPSPTASRRRRRALGRPALRLRPEPPSTARRRRS
jgi:2-keto-3-deoxy-L-rhamnonate aldolase RhmA